MKKIIFWLLIAGTSFGSFASASLYPFLDIHCFMNEGEMKACEPAYQPAKSYLDKFMPKLYNVLEDRVVDTEQRTSVVAKVHAKILERVKTKTDKNEIFIFEYIAYKLGLFINEETGYMVNLNKGQATHNYGEVVVNHGPALTKWEMEALRTQPETKWTRVDTTSTAEATISTSSTAWSTAVSTPTPEPVHNTSSEASTAATASTNSDG